VLSGTVSFNDSKAEWTRPYSVELPPNNRDAILAKRPYRRTRYFGRNELSGLVMGALRLATRPLTLAEIATAVLQAKEMPTGDMAFKEIVAARVLTVLRRLAKRGDGGEVRDQPELSRNAQWAIAHGIKNA
jgi:hypothetical protein